MAKAEFQPEHLELRFQPDISPERPWVGLRAHSYEDDSTYVEVPRGFASDLASVPPLLYWIYGPYQGYQRAAFFHDWLYTNKQTSRWTADSIFRAIMEYDGVPPWQAISIFYAVRLFGWTRWREK